MGAPYNTINTIKRSFYEIKVKIVIYIKKLSKIKKRINKLSLYELGLHGGNCRISD